MAPQVSLDSEQQFHQDTLIQDRDPGVTSSTPGHVEPWQPEKKPTRQWAAWTRQEEESFFTALQQVGKNFEKITRHVQSKNKDQVRHYYYRLVRRMNKLLGPGLCLDAKNSKDTNAAMLRWWSLLEKYSCKASKLHLKPRRFKIFIEALENQLLKDRKKNIRKRSSNGENGSPTAPTTITNQNRASGNDTRAVKLVLIDSQQKLGGKGSLKRNVNMGAIRNNSKGESTAIKPARQRRKPVSSAAYKKWEKAAIAGVSLVADAAEHLERTAPDKEVEHDREQKGCNPVENILSPLSPSSVHFVESNAHNNIKLKLQLFPIDDGTRRALEMDKHNPHLELTLSTRKKISSVLEHLNRKWGKSSVASGELVLFPYSASRENLVGYQRWTQDSLVSAADVYFSIGSPPVFRLRYGWFSNAYFASVTLQAPSAYSCVPDAENEEGKIVDFVSSEPSTNNQFEKPEDPCRDCPTSEGNSYVSATHSTGVSNKKNEFIGTVPSNNFDKSFVAAADTSWHRKETGDKTNTKHLETVDASRLNSDTVLSAGEWADSLTNISVGELLSEVPHQASLNCMEPPVGQSDEFLEQIPFSCDSFDAAIAAHISKHQSKVGSPSMGSSHASSIWDGEVTCDAFSFQKNKSLCKEAATSSVAASPQVGKQMAKTSPMASGAFLEELPDIDRPMGYPGVEDPMDEGVSDSLVDNQAKDVNGLTDIYWPDSLGLLDLDIPSSKYHSEDLILSDSLGGLNHLIASSLDAFQNCSFFGLNKKDSTSTVEVRETTSFSEFKVSGGSCNFTRLDVKRCHP